MLDLRVIPKPGEPVDARLAAKPGHLALCILPGRRLGLADAFLEANFSAKHRPGVPVAQGPKGLDAGGRPGRAAHQGAPLFHKTRSVHLLNSPVNPPAEFSPVGVQADVEDPKTAQARPAATEYCRAG